MQAGWLAGGGIYSENDLLFSLFFFFKKNRENKKDGVPSLPGGGWGGDRRVHASGASLDLYPAGFHYFYLFYFYY